MSQLGQVLLHSAWWTQILVSIFLNVNMPHEGRVNSYHADEVQTLHFYPLTIQDEFDVVPETGKVISIRKLKAYHDYHLYFNVRDNGIPEEFFSELVLQFSV